MHLGKTGFDIQMKPKDCICSTCYKLHLSILKGVEDKTNSPDNELRDSIEFWRFKVMDGTTDELTRAVLKTVIFKAEHLLQQKAVLLPRLFISHYTSASDSIIGRKRSTYRGGGW